MSCRSVCVSDPFTRTPHQQTAMGVRNGEAVQSDAVSDVLSQVSAGCCDLDATGRVLSPSEIETIASSLANSKSVRTTLLARTRLGDSGAVQLAEGIRKNRSCTAYFLGHNGIGAHGAKAIAAALQGNDTVFRLNLSGNPIGVEGVRALVQLAASQPNIKQLILDNCDLDDAALDAMQQLLTSHNVDGLASISIWNNKFSAARRATWQQALQGHQSLLQVDLPEPIVNLSLAAPQRYTVKA